MIYLQLLSVTYCLTCHRNSKKHGVCSLLSPFLDDSWSVRFTTIQKLNGVIWCGTVILCYSWRSDMIFLDELVQAGWAKCWSKRENRPYYFNRFTNQSLWEMPVLGQHDVIVSEEESMLSFCQVFYIQTHIMLLSPLDHLELISCPDVIFVWFINLYCQTGPL